MEEKKKTKKQLEKEAEQRKRANLSFLRGADLLMQWMAFKDFVLNDFYKAVLDLATEKEDQGEADDFGFSIYLYNVSMSHQHFKLSQSETGLAGLHHLLCWATQWLNDEIRAQEGETADTDEPEAFESLTVAEEMEGSYIRESLNAFAEACETVGSADGDQWVNLYFDFHHNEASVPDELDFANIEAVSLCYPDSLKTRFENILNDMTDNTMT